jgi:glutamine synthetase
MQWWKLLITALSAGFLWFKENFSRKAKAKKEAYEKAEKKIEDKNLRALPRNAKKSLKRLIKKQSSDGSKMYFSEELLRFMGLSLLVKLH